VARLKFLRDMRAHASMLEFSLGCWRRPKLEFSLGCWRRPKTEPLLRSVPI
jgi:hypothetical protein